MAVACPKCHHENPGDTVFCGRCATRLDSPAGRSFTMTMETNTEELTRGLVFAGRYEIIEELGSGGMGKVYRAFDTKMEEEVALKLIKPEIVAEKRVVERFRNEIKIARKITHKNVCRMHDLNEDGRTLYLTMEYVRGEDLKSLIRRTKQLAPGTAAAIGRQIAEGLAEAHQLGIVHRDLKPHNIMIDKEGNAKIMDFGIARSIETRGITSERAVIGTPEYMSPEQVEGRDTDGRSDIYALGILLYEMLTGRVPFEGETAFSVAAKQRSETPQVPRKINPQIPEDLSRLILRCLEKDPAKRFQGAGDVRDALAAIERSFPSTERIIPRREQLSSREITVTFRLKKLVIPAVGVAALVVLAVMIRLILPKKSPTPPNGKPSLAVLYFENSTGDPALDPWKTGLSDLLIISLSQSRAITVLNDTRTYGVLKKLKLDQAGKYGPDDLVKVANEGRVNHTASGRLIKAGGNIIITLTLWDPRAGSPVSSRQVECRGETEIYPAKVDELAAIIRADLNLTPAQSAADAPKAIAQIMTNSPEALKYYLKSVEGFRMMDYARSIALMEKAVELDPDFAMAHCSLAMLYTTGSGNSSKIAAEMKKALDLRERLPAKERYYIEANNSNLHGETTADKTIELYKKYFEFAPDDAAEMESMGYAYWFLEEWDKGLEIMERMYHLEKVPHFLRSIIGAYERVGQYDKADQTYRDYLKDGEDRAEIHEYATWLQIIRRRFDLAFAEIEKGFLLDPKSGSWEGLKAEVYFYKGDLPEAEKIYFQMLKSENKGEGRWGMLGLRATNLLRGRFGRASEDLGRALSPGGDLAGREKTEMAYVFLRSKQYAKALEIIDKLYERSIKSKILPYQRTVLWWKGLIHVAQKSGTEADKDAAELKKVIEACPRKKSIRYYDHLKGLMEIEKGNFGKAAEILQRACSLLPNESDAEAGYNSGTPLEIALFLDPLAFAYYRSGDLDKARAEYERLTSLTLGRWGWDDLCAKSFYMLGKIAEEQKDKKRAGEYFREFLNLWKDADPGQPEVEDARKRLEALR